MKRLFLIRHGDYEKGELNEFGKQQMTRMGESIRSLAIGTSYIASSPAKRAYQSAEIISRALSIGNVEAVEFFSPYEFNHGIKGHYEKLMGIVDERSGEADNLVLVAHLPLVEPFAPFFAKSKEIDFDGKIGPKKGEGVLHRHRRKESHHAYAIILLVLLQQRRDVDVADVLLG